MMPLDSRKIGIFDLKASADPTLQTRQRIFNEAYKDWISAYNADIEKNGLWCDAQEAWKEAKL